MRHGVTGNWNGIYCDILMGIGLYRAVHWWLRSPYSSNNNNAYYVNTDGSVYSNYVYYGDYCARPALYLESSILVSVEVETDDIEKMQDKVTALQRETLTACKNAELIAELFRRIPGVQED